MTIKQSAIKKCGKNLAFSTHDKNNQNLLAYEKDFFKWTKIQVNHLKKKDFSKLDTENLIEELKALGRAEKRILRGDLAPLLLHLLKIECQPGKHTKSWDNSVKNSRHEIKLLLKENSSLKKYLPDILENAYYTARLNAISETGLNDEVFLEQCPWSLEEVL